VERCWISPEGAWIASSGADSSLRIWNVAAGTEHQILPYESTKALSWAPDGSWFVSVGMTAARLCSTADGSRRVDLSGRRSLGTCCAVRPNGAWIAVGNMGLKPELWIVNARTGAEVASFRIPTGWVTVCAWSPDGSRLLAGIENGGLACLVFERPAEEGAVLQGRGFPVTACAWRADGGLVAAAMGDGTLLLWSARPGDEGRVLEGHTGEIVTCAWSPDGRRLVSASTDGTLRLWDPAAPQEPAKAPAPPGHLLAVRDCAWSPDGAALATVGDDGTLRTWDAVGGRERRVIETGTHLIHPISAVAWSPDGARLVTAGHDGVLRIWDAASGEERHPLRCFELAALTGALFRMRAGAASDAEDPDVLENLKLHACAWSPGGRLVASGGEDTTVQLWDAASGARQQRLTEHTNGVTAVAWSPDGTLLASAGEHAALSVRDGVTGVLRRTLDGYAPVAWSPAGNLLGAAGFVRGYLRDGSLRIWNAGDGAELRVLAGRGGRVRACAWSPDGGRIASAGDDRTLHIWDADPRAAPAVLTGHDAPVTDCAWSADGRYLASASADRTLRVWDAASGRNVITLPTLGRPTCLARHPSLPLLAAGDEGGTLYLLRLEGLG
jgi:WD40 repeat protein